MLSPEEKLKIREEELYRARIRNKKQPAAAHSSIWTLINSNFFIWLMSTCIVSFLTWKFSEWKTEAEQARTKNEKIEKLDQEIGTRIEDAAFISTFSEFQYKRQQSGSTKYLNPCGRLLNKPDPSKVYLEEYKERNLISLLVELRNTLPTGAQKRRLQEALDATRNLSNRFNHLDSLDQQEYASFNRSLQSIKQIRWDQTLNTLEEVNKIREEADGL